MANENDNRINGLAELRAARDAWSNAEDAYMAARSAAQERGDNWPAKPDPELAVTYKRLRGEHPRAVMYLKAEAYTYAANYHKVAAGKKAMELLLDGGDVAEAGEILDNWLPPSAMWD